MATARSCSTSGLSRTTVCSSSVTLTIRGLPGKGCLAQRPGRLPRRPAAAALAAIDRLAETLDPLADLAGERLEGGAVDHQPRGHLGDVLDLDEVVGLQRGAARDQIDDAAAQAQHRRQLDRAA